jgi:hypothetical protein
MFRLMPLELVYSAQPWRSVQSQSGSKKGYVERWNSANSGPEVTGKGEEP